MAHGREVRLPFLSHELVQFIFTLPAACKIRQGETKWLLRKSMENNLPKNIVRRRDKVGFEPPQKQWMESVRLQEYIREAKTKLVRAGVVEPSVLAKKIQPHNAYAVENYDWRYLVASVCTTI
jgi:asparagine synthase (glutamine-hydrolysing)